MPDDIIDFDAEKERRIDAATTAAIDENQAEWDRVRLRLTWTMATSSLSDTALISAALRALLDVLDNSGLSLDDDKARIAKSLAAFYEF